MQKILSLLKRVWVLLRHCFRRDQIVVIQANLSGDGSFIDVRYWLSRPDKINPQTRIYLVHSETGTRLEVMKLAKTGVALFWNRDNLITSGCKASLIVGSIRTDNIEIR